MRERRSSAMRTRARSIRKKTSTISLRQKIQRNRKSTAASPSRTGTVHAKLKNRSRTILKSRFALFRSTIPSSRGNAFLPVNLARGASFGPRRIKECRSLLTAGFAPVYSRCAMELKLYSREWCSWCIDAKDYLTEKGYRFEEINVGEDRQAYEHMKQLSAQTYVPTFVAVE